MNRRDVTRIEVDGESIAVICRHGLLRDAARDWSTYTSATPFRVPIPEESDVRPVRQYPIETDPPEHREYRRLIEARFSRAAAEQLRPTIETEVDRILAAAVRSGRLEVVPDLALPIVTTAIASTMGRPEDADRFRSWGLHVFYDPDTGRRTPNADLDRYLAERTDTAIAEPGDDIFGDLASGDIGGRPLTRDEILGYGYLVLAGGRDTVIASIAGALAFLAAHPGIGRDLRGRPDAIATATEEFLRYISPLPLIGRTATRDVDIGGVSVECGQRVALGFAAANRDADVFDQPDECLIDRSPNRHVAFGHGPHTCIGAPLARMQLQVVIQRFVDIDNAGLSPSGRAGDGADVTSTHPDDPNGVVVRFA